jgi:hypothetical protein
MPPTPSPTPFVPTSPRTGFFKGVCLFLAVFATIAFSSCAVDVANRYYGAQTYTPKDPKEVELLYRAPSRPFTVIADLQSRNETPNSMRKRAAKIGADAVIVTPLGGYSSLSQEWAGRDTHANSYSRLVGSAIKYTK